MPKVHKDSSARLIVIFIILLLWSAAIGARLYWLQIRQHDSLRSRAENQQQDSLPLLPMRGVIYDRNGKELARSSEVKSLYVQPSQLGDLIVATSKLAKILDLDRATLLERFQSRKKSLVVVKRRLTDKEVEQVEKLNLPPASYRFINEMKRFYLNNQTAAHLLGYVDMEENGRAGIEQIYNQTIRGDNGKLTLKFDNIKRKDSDPRNPYDCIVEQSSQGSNVHLTIDSVIQLYAEKALKEGVVRSGAKGGTIVMMRPQTGEILALASYPTFNPNDISEMTDAQRQNRAVEAIFEPGSIFKIVAYAGALEEKLIKPNTMIDCGNGKIEIAKRIIHDTHSYGVLTASQALAKSSNIGAIKIARQLGNETFARYIDAFGFGRKTNIELPAESKGIVRDVKKWRPDTIGSIPMGQEVGVTAVQAIAAFSCIANGGVWIQPHLVKYISGAAGEITAQPQVESRRVISEQTASMLKTMLEGVVLRGTAKAAQLDGYSVAGKTGTAQKVINGKYSDTKYVASFAGFAPVQNPEIVCIVSLDEPIGEHHGGTVAAPIFAEAVSYALNILGVPPETNPESLIAGEVQTYQVSAMGEKHSDKDAETIAKDSHATQTPQSASKADSALLFNAATTEQPDAEETVQVAPHNPNEIAVPDLRGRGVREAMAVCANHGLNIQASGEGVVTSQMPNAGSYVTRETILKVKLAKPGAGKPAILPKQLLATDEKQEKKPTQAKKQPPPKAQNKKAAKAR
jgi:cell division protein FtsI/penicillin-binding protein 2